MKTHQYSPAESDRHEIEFRAYQLWVAAGSPVGPDTQFWMQAKAEVDSGSPRHVLPSAAPETMPRGKTFGSSQRLAA